MALEQYGNTTTFNIESVLHKNIKDGEYFNKTCVKLTTFAELVDEARPPASVAAAHCPSHSSAPLPSLLRAPCFQLPPSLLGLLLSTFGCLPLFSEALCTPSQIYYSVSHIEPWMSGNARGASSAFCLLFRLAQLQPTEDQVQELIDHGDSPYIRAVGDQLSDPPP